jgi:tetratricopeptide (TPR) repeat protein
MMDGQMLPAVRQSVINYMWIGRFADAAVQEEKALRLAQAKYGSLHPKLVPILNDLGTLYRIEAQYRKADEDIRWGLAIREKVLGLEDPSVAESLAYLAGLDLDLGRYLEAEVCYQRALKIREKNSGKDSNEVADILQQLGTLYVLMGRGSDALSVLNHCLQIREKNSGAGDLKSGDILEAMAQAAQVQGDDKSAEDFYKRALSVRQKNLPLDRSEVLEYTETLADFYLAKGRKVEAKALYAQTEKIRDRFLSTTDFVNLPNLHAAAMADLILGRLKDSGLLLTRVLKLRKEIYGPDHPKVALCLEDFAALEEAEGQKAKAIARLKEAKVMLEKVFDPEHPELLKIQKKLDSLSR